jgi:hypothetical protein
MRTVKIADLVIQFILFAGGLIYGLQHITGGDFVKAYFPLGGWQVLGCLVHGFSDKNLFFRKERKYYAITLICILLTGFLALIISLSGAYLFFAWALGLLIISPFLAIWYFSICFREVQLMNRRAMVHLK